MLGIFKRPGKLFAGGIVIGFIGAMVMRAGMTAIGGVLSLLGGLAILVSAIWVLAKKNGQF